MIGSKKSISSVLGFCAIKKMFAPLSAFFLYPIELFALQCIGQVSFIEVAIHFNQYTKYPVDGESLRLTVYSIFQVCPGRTPGFIIITHDVFHILYDNSQSICHEDDMIVCGDLLNNKNSNLYEESSTILSSVNGIDKSTSIRQILSSSNVIFFSSIKLVALLLASALLLLSAYNIIGIISARIPNNNICLCLFFSQTITI
ncbi:MAG: hypothetical protein WCH65_04025 [bacterium]